MAIRLASAIGQQREPIGILGGLDEAINKTGDAIAEGIKAQNAEKAKKADQEQKLKDAIAASTDFTPLVNVHPNDREKDLQFKQKGYNAIMIAAADPKITRSQLEKIQIDYIKEAQDNKYVMERDWEAIQSVAGKQETHDTERFNNLLMKGHTNPTTTAEMPNNDFMAASEENRAGKLPSAETSTDKTTERQIIGVDGKPTTITSTESVDNGSRGMKATETTTSFQGVPYLDRPISERKMTNIKALENELTTLKRPNIVLASKGYFGDNHKFASYTKKTDKITPTTGEIIYEFDEKGADLDARKFASSMIGDGNFGDKSHKQYQRALEYEAMDKGTEAGLSGEKLKDFVQESVAKVAYEDFMQNARSAEADRIKNDREVTKAPRSEGGGFNITVGGGGNNKIWNIGDAVEAPLYEVKDGKKTDKVIGDYYYHSIQTAAAGENPKKFNIAGKTDVQVEGVSVNKKTGKPEYVDITIPSRYDKYENLVKGTGIKKTVRITEDTEIENLKTNLGKDLYDKTIGAHKPEKTVAAKEAMYIVNGVAYPKSKLEKRGYDISKLKEYK